MSEENSGGAAADNIGNDVGGDCNRWPQQETLALLQVRYGFDEEFRVSSIKAPLWDEVSRRLAEFGYHRSAKKCKEKFENIYKYNKRTKEGRSGRQDGKNYKFSEQLEIFDGQSSFQMGESIQKTTTNPVLMVQPESEVPRGDVVAPSFTETPSFEHIATSTSTTSSSGEDSERNIKKKRKVVDYIGGLMNHVLERQENLQNKFIEAIENFDKDRLTREEEWKAQQMSRKRKEQGILAEERSVSAAKDAAILSFMQKFSEQSSPLQLLELSSSLAKILSMKEFNIFDNLHVDKSIIDNSTLVASSRWPKAEVEALITLRENLNMYGDSGPKGSLWEVISSAMKKLGYNRSAKRCKEKWENMNKYYRRVKDGNKKRPQDSKTCQYFDMLDSLYEKKSRKFENSTSDSSGCNLKPEDILMQMTGHHHQQEHVIRNLVTKDFGESENVDPTPEQDEAEDDDEDDYHVVGNRNPSDAMEE